MRHENHVRVLITGGARCVASEKTNKQNPEILFSKHAQQHHRNANHVNVYTSCRRQDSWWAWSSTHPWANVTGNGHAVQEVEEERLASSVETIETVRKGHVIDLYQRHLEPDWYDTLRSDPGDNKQNWAFFVSTVSLFHLKLLAEGCDLLTNDLIG